MRVGLVRIARVYRLLPLVLLTIRGWHAFLRRRGGSVSLCSQRSFCSLGFLKCTTVQIQLSCSYTCMSEQAFLGCMTAIVSASRVYRKIRACVKDRPTDAQTWTCRSTNIYRHARFYVRISKISNIGTSAHGLYVVTHAYQVRRTSQQKCVLLLVKVRVQWIEKSTAFVGLFVCYFCTRVHFFKKTSVSPVCFCRVPGVPCGKREGG